MAEDTRRADQSADEYDEAATFRGAHSPAVQQPNSDAAVPDYIAAALAEMEESTPVEQSEAAAVPVVPAVVPAPQPAPGPQPASAPAHVSQPTPAQSVAPGATVPRPPVTYADARAAASEAPVLNTHEVFAVPDAPDTPQVDAIGQTGEFEPVITQTATSVETGAPRPIGVDPASTGAFSTISAGEGAVITNRDTAAAAKDAALSSHSASSLPKRSGRTREATNAAVSSFRKQRGIQQQQSKTPIIIAAIAVVTALVVAGFLFLTYRAKTKPENPSGQEPIEQVLVDPSGNVEFGGYRYALQQDQNGVWSVMRTSASATAGSPIINLPGTPVALVLCDGALYIPENLENNWDVIAYMLADGSEAIQLTTAEGDLLGGQGALAEAKLNGTTLTLVDAEGQSYTAVLD